MDGQLTHRTTSVVYIDVTTSVVYIDIYICARIDMLPKSKCRRRAPKRYFVDLNPSYRGIYRH